MSKIPVNASGFTLMELITTVSIAGVLTAIAVPTFSTIISSNRLTAHTNEFITALNLARSEAIKRGTKVTIGRNIDSTSNNWQKGWDVFVDIDADGQFNDNADEKLCETDTSGGLIEDCLLRTYSELPSKFTLISNNSFKDTIIFNDGGRSNTGSLILCDNNRNKTDLLTTAKVIIISATGRARIGIDSNIPPDGIPNLSSGLNIDKCTP
jgi:type IV fimbrial biogenesis protein FimT